MSHVLLLEPNTLLAHTYSEALAYAGFTVAVAAGAQQGIHSADEHCPDVIVLELQLPRHNGVEFLHELRSYAEWQRIPVIIHTAMPVARMSDDRHHLLQDSLGVQVLLYKHSASLTDLVEAVRMQVAIS